VIPGKLSMIKITFVFGIIFYFLLVSANPEILFSTAVQAGNAQKVEEAIQQGADVNLIEDEWPLFITSVTAGDTAVISVFLKNGVNTELKGPDGKTALMHALALRNNNVVNMLINAGADLSAADPSGKNIMMYAAEGNNPKVLKMLLDKGFDRNIKSDAGKTALDYAIEARAGDCFRMLSQIDKQPIDFFDAVSNNNSQRLRDLIRQGVNVNIRDKDGKAGIVIAIEKKFNDILRILLDNGADLNGSYFKSSADLFIFALHNNNFEGAELLLRKGIKTNLNHRYKGGKSALMIAIEQDRLTLINLIMQNSFNPDLTDEFGNTALMYAASRNMISTVKNLLEKNSDPTIRQVAGKTAGDIAKEKGHSALARILEEESNNWN
jgi:ankyrin repeat protein